MPRSFPPPETLAQAGAQTNPGANTTIVTLGTLPAGTYRVSVSTFQAGTVSANRANMELRKGSTTVTALLSIAQPQVDMKDVTIVVDGSQAVLVRSGSSGEAGGAIYGAMMHATRID